MEGLLARTMKDTQKAREGIVELEKLKTENLELQNKMKQDQVGLGEENEAVRGYKQQIEQQNQTIEELRHEIDNQRPQTAGLADWEDQRIQMETELEMHKAKINALEDEALNSTTMYANEIVQLKAKLAETEAKLIK